MTEKTKNGFESFFCKLGANTQHFFEKEVPGFFERTGRGAGEFFEKTGKGAGEILDKTGKGAGEFFEKTGKGAQVFFEKEVPNFFEKTSRGAGKILEKTGKEAGNFLEKTGKGISEVFSEKNVEISIDTINVELKKVEEFLQETASKMEVKSGELEDQIDEKNDDVENNGDTEDVIAKYQNTEILNNFGDTISSIVTLGAKITVIKIESIIDKIPENVRHHSFQGFSIAALKIACRYIIKLGGRRSNIVSVLDANFLNSLGNARSFARVDMPHGNVPFHHINVNPKITGLPDPHFPISAASANIAGGLGRCLNFVNKIAPVLMAISIAIDIYRILRSARKDFKTKSSRNTVKTIVEIVLSILGGVGGCLAGSALGTAIFPGIGTMIGGLTGGVIGGIGGGISAEIVCEIVMDYFQYEIDFMICEKCHKEFENRRYAMGEQKNCKGCGPFKAIKNS